MEQQSERNRHEKIKEIFSAVIELSTSKQSDFLQTACGGDKDLRREVESLLLAREEAGKFLEEVSAVNVIHDSINRTDKFTGELIDKYRIVREIGRGGMGVVFLAEREDFHQNVALKVIKRGMDSDIILERFKREREILASLNHPLIAKLLDGGTTGDGLPYFVMEFVEGAPINEYAEAHNLSINKRLQLFRKVCSAVSYAHQNLIIHRDIKPSNIFVNEDGEPKLLDFGIAKLLTITQSTEMPVATATLMRVMTPEYASPEQIRGENINTASDVYSLGVLLYELLTGHRPYHFKSNSPADVASAICETEPERPSQAITGSKTDPKPETENRKALRGDLDNIVLMALRKEPARRYASVGEFSEDIRRHLEGLPVKARQDTFSYRASKFVKRNKIAVSAALIVLLTLTGGIIATTWEAHVARAERAKAEQRFDDVRKLAHTFIFDYNDAISYFPGTVQLRQRMIQDALEYLDSLSKEAGSDPPLQQELALAYIKIGDMEGRNTIASLGDTKGAFDNYQKASMMLEKLNTNDPQNIEIRHDLALNYERLGESYGLSGKPAEAAQFYRQSLNIFEELHISDPTDLELQDFLGYTHRLLGQALGVPPAANLGDSKGALEQLQEAAKLIDALPDEKIPPNPKRPFPLIFDKKYDLASIYSEISIVLDAMGDKAESINYQRKAVTLLEARSTEEPNNAVVKRNLAVNYGNLGTDLLNKGEIQAALPLFRQSLTIEENLAAADENNIDAKKDVAVGYRNLAKAQAVTNDKKNAAESYQKAIAIFEELVAKDPSNAFMRRNLAFTYLKMSLLLSETGDITAALNYARRSESICEELVAANAKNMTAQNTLAQTYTQLGDCRSLLAVKETAPRSQQIEQWSEARDWYQKSLNIWQDMKNQGTLSATDSGKPDDVLRKIAKCDEVLNIHQS